MRLSRFSVPLVLVLLTSISAHGAAVPNQGAVRTELSAYFRDIAKNSPTVLGGLAKSPEVMAAIQKRIAGMSNDELSRFQTLMAQAPDWKVAPETFASAFPPAVRDQAARVAADYAQKVPSAEVMRENVRALIGVLKLLPDAKLKELKLDRKQIASLETTFEQMTPLQAAMLQKRFGRDASGSAIDALPPALQRGAAALAEHGPLTEKDIAELETFRREIIGVFVRIEKLPPSAKQTLDVKNVTAQIAQLRSAPPDVLFMVRHNIPAETLKTLKSNVAFLSRVASFSPEENAKLEQFRSDFGNALKQLHAPGIPEWSEADAMLARLAPQDLFVLQQRMQPLGEWQAALPALYQSLASPETVETMRALRGASPDPTIVSSLQAFRRDALAYVDSAAMMKVADARLIAHARATLESAPLDRLELIRSTIGRMPPTATAGQRFSAVVMNDVNLNCSLSMTAVPELCVPEACAEICDPTGILGCARVCTPGFCTPAVTVTANFDVICNPLETALQTVKDGITTSANAAVETMRSSIQTSINAVQSAVNTSIASVNSVVNSSVSAITSTVNDIYAFVQTIPDLAWKAIRTALDLLLDIEIKNGVKLRQLVSEGPEAAMTAMKQLLGLANNWWSAVSNFTLPAIPCPPAGFHTPFGNMGDGAAAANYGRYRLLIDNIVGMIPDTEISLKVKIPAQLTFMMFDFLGVCLDQAAGDADQAEGTARHTLVLTNFAVMQTYVGGQITGLSSASGSQSTATLNLLNQRFTETQASIVTQGQATEALINNQTNSTTTLINGKSAENEALVQSTSDEAQKNLLAFRDLDVRLTIERILQGGNTDGIASLELPAPAGHLDLVRDIVMTTIHAMTQAQEGIGQAQTYYNSGVQLMTASKYKDALKQFMKSYQETTKGKV